MSVVVPRASVRDVFAVREFRGLFAAQATSMVGDQLARVAVAILVFQWSDSAFLAALTYSVSFLPAIVAGPLFGYLADTRPRRQVMLVCDLVRALLVAVMLLPHLHTWMYIGVLFVVSWLDPPFNAARSALLPEVLPGELYSVGQSISGVTSSMAQIAGFGAGGAAVALLTPRGGLALDVGQLPALSLPGSFHRRSPGRHGGQVQPARLGPGDVRNADRDA